MSHKARRGGIQLVIAAVLMSVLVCGCGSSARTASQTSTSTSRTSTAAVAQAKTSTRSTSTTTAATSRTHTAKHVKALPTALVYAANAYIGCMHKHGVDLPPPNLTGEGELVDTQGVDTKAYGYELAASACRKVATSVFHRAQRSHQLLP